MASRRPKQRRNEPIAGAPSVWLARAMVAVAVLLTYSNSFSVPFIFDDTDSIHDNPYIRQLWPLTSALTAPKLTSVSGRPLVSLSLAINYAISGLDVWSYHAANLLLHIVNCLLLLEIVRLSLAYRGWGTRSVTFATALTLVWAVHPLHTETVIYVIQRTELLFAAFALLTLYASIRAWDSRHARVWLMTSVAMCAVGMATKENMVATPLLVVLYDLGLRCTNWRALLRQRGRYYAALASTWTILVVLMAQSPRGASVGWGQRMSTLDYLMTQGWVLGRYLRLAVFPWGWFDGRFGLLLCMDYGMQAITDWRRFVPGGFVVLAMLAVTAFSWWRSEQWGWLGFLGAVFFFILGPTSSFIPFGNQIAAERRVYLPIAAFFTVLLLGVCSLLRRWNKADQLLLIVAVVFCLPMALASWSRSWIYQNEEAIWRDVVAKVPNNSRAWDNLGSQLIARQQSVEGLTCLQEAVRVDPRYQPAHAKLGTIYLQLGQLDAAEQYLQRSVALAPQSADAMNMLGRLRVRQGRIEEAAGLFERAVKFDPSVAEFYVNLASILRSLRRNEEALVVLHRAFDARLNTYELRREAGTVAALLNRFDEAITQFQRGLLLRPGDIELCMNLAVVFAKTGKPDQAIDYARQAASVSPPHARAMMLLGMLLHQQRQSAEAEQWLRTALKVEPKSAELHLRLAEVLTALGRSSEASEFAQRALQIDPHIKGAREFLRTDK